jgi:hypothetical protein
VNLIPLSSNGLLVPPDWQSASRVLCIPGSMVSGYEGWATMVLTPDALAVITPAGVEEAVPLDGIEDVSVRKFEGILIERPTSIGTVLSRDRSGVLQRNPHEAPAPGGHARGQCSLYLGSRYSPCGSKRTTEGSLRYDADEKTAGKPVTLFVLGGLSDV